MPINEHVAIDVDGRQRQFLLHLPEQSGHSVPLIVMFHGAGATVDWTADETGWSGCADRQGFAVVYPQGLPPDPSKPAKFLTNPPYWHDGTNGNRDGAEQRADLRFVSLMLDAILERFPIDRQRVFATGFSNGAGMTFTVAARMAERIAAVAPVAGHCVIDDPRPSRPVPTFYMIGDSDPLIPLAGGRVRTPWGRARQKPSVAETLRKWAAAIGCEPTPTLLASPEGTRLESFHADDDPDRFLALTIAGMGHHWPGGKGRFSEKIAGRRVSGIDACERIWEFFERQLGRGCANLFWHEYENWLKGGISFKEGCPMSHATISVETPFENLVVEQALAFAREMEATANGAADGKVLDQCELLTLSKGRDLLRAILTGAAQQQADAVEKKGRRLAPVNAASTAGTKAVRRELS